MKTSASLAVALALVVGCQITIPGITTEAPGFTTDAPRTTRADVDRACASLTSELGPDFVPALIISGEASIQNGFGKSEAVSDLLLVCNLYPNRLISACSRCGLRAIDFVYGD
jgi:hypothetical protein